MRFSKPLFTCAAAALLVAAAAAQEDAQEAVAKQEAAAQVEEPAPSATEAPAPQAPAQPPEVQGLEGLQGTVDALQDQPEAPATEAPAAAPSTPAPPLTAAEQAQLRRHVERGRLLAAIARAGMIATQDMLSRVADPEGAGIAGWLALPEGNAMTVTFYADTDAGPRAVYRANVLGGRVTSRNVYTGADRPPLGPTEARMAAARAVAAGQEHRPCGGDQFNYLVVPPANADAPVVVYQVTPAVQRGRIPLGGHFRTTVMANGSVAEMRGFTNACLDAELPPAAAGQPPRPIGVTHLLDPTPTEIHVLTAMLAGRPLLVATGGPERVWLVTGASIAEVRPRTPGR
ncbi:MAG TPA: hypothetical protein VF704_03440 [Allosphingosinicella sp.]